MSHFNQCWRDFRFFSDGKWRIARGESLIAKLSLRKWLSGTEKKSKKMSGRSLSRGKSTDFFRRKKAISRALLRKQSGPEWADIFQTNSGDFFPIYIPRPRNKVHLFWFSFGVYVPKSWISVHVDCQYVTEFCPSDQNWTHFCWQTDEIKLFSFHQTVEDSL